MGKIIKNGIEYSSAVPNLTNILHTELDAYTADFDEKLATKSATYTTLDELGLTADATVDDVYSALKDGETATADAVKPFMGRGTKGGDMAFIHMNGTAAR